MLARGTGPPRPICAVGAAQDDPVFTNDNKRRRPKCRAAKPRIRSAVLLFPDRPIGTGIDGAVIPGSYCKPGRGGYRFEPVHSATIQQRAREELIYSVGIEHSSVLARDNNSLPEKSDGTHGISHVGVPRQPQIQVVAGEDLAALSNLHT